MLDFDRNELWSAVFKEKWENIVVGKIGKSPDADLFNW